MIDLRSLFLIAGVGLAAAMPAQAGRSGSSETPPAAGTQPPGEATAARSTAELIEQLGSDRFRSRVEAEQALRKLGAAAVPDLESAAAKSADNEVQWRARRLLRQIKGEQGSGLQRDPRRGDKSEPEVQQPQTQQPGMGRRSGRAESGRGAEIQRRFDEMFGELERDFGVEVPRRSFFGDDFFRDLTDQMSQLRDMASGSSTSIQIKGDGSVRVEVQEVNEAGKSEKKVYEASSMEEFQELHPGVLPGSGLPRLQIGRVNAPSPWPQGRLQLRSSPFDAAPGLPFVELTPGGQVQAKVAAGEVLGVQVRPEIGSDLRDHLGLADGVGLMVEAVTPDSLASAMGLQRGDIVLEVAGSSIGGPADVHAALAGVTAGKDVEVVCLRKGKRTKLSAAKPEVVEQDADAAEPAKEGGRLQRRNRRAGETIR